MYILIISQLYTVKSNLRKERSVKVLLNKSTFMKVGEGELQHGLKDMHIKYFQEE